MKTTKLERSAQTGISYKTLRNLERLGCDIWDDDDLRKHISRMRALPKNIKPQFAPQVERLETDAELPTLDDLMKRLSACTDRHQAQTIRCQIDGLKAAHQLQVQRGNYMRREEAYAEAHLVGLHIKQMLYYKMPAELTPRLVGRSSAEIADELQAFARQTLTLLHEKGYMERVVQESHRI